MSTQMERMKQLIEAKKKNGQNAELKRPDKGSNSASSKGFNSKKNGGAFDK